MSYTDQVGFWWRDVVVSSSVLDAMTENEKALCMQGGCLFGDYVNCQCSAPVGGNHDECEEWTYRTLMIPPASIRPYTYLVMLARWQYSLATAVVPMETEFYVGVVSADGGPFVGRSWSRSFNVNGNGTLYLQSPPLDVSDLAGYTLRYGLRGSCEVTSGLGFDATGGSRVFLAPILYSGLAGYAPAPVFGWAVWGAWV